MAQRAPGEGGFGVEAGARASHGARDGGEELLLRDSEMNVGGSGAGGGHEADH